MGRISKQKRLLIEQANKRLLGEAYEGIIKQNDDVCDIKCKRKIAKSGSSGDVVKMIQHLLYNNGYNKPKSGGGMSGDVCYGKYQHCDGLFRNHTKDAVKEFQGGNGLTVDGVVGPNTYNKMCEVLKFTHSLRKDEFCKQCQCEETDKKKDDSKDELGDIDVIDNSTFIKLIDKYDCDSLKACIKKLFSKKDMISSNQISLCMTSDVKDAWDSAKGIWDQDWSCDDCPDTVNLMPGPGQRNIEFKNWCKNNCGSKAVY